MSLADFVMWCRLCDASDAFAGEGRTTTCQTCGTTYEYDPDRARLVARSRNGRLWEIDEAVDDVGQGRAREARAVARFAYDEAPVRHQGGLLGFVEQRGPKIPGVLRLESDRVEFVPDGGELHVWPLLDIRAVQTASASVQISPLGGGVVTFALAEASPRWWERMLRFAVSAAWLAEGRGRVVEFQPRIRTG